MLTPELVRVRRQGEKLLLQKWTEQDRLRALQIAEDLLGILKSHEGTAQEEVQEALEAVDRNAREDKIWAGLKKLLLDATEFGAPTEIEPVQLRQRVFQLASERRLQASSEEPFLREQVLEEVAREYAVEPALLEEALFSDLKGAARLVKMPPLTPETLVDAYELGQVQGVLLRAVRLVVEVRCRRPEDYRALFHKLKFRQLLYQIEEQEEGRYRLQIDGPFSLFESVTKYGLALALLVPDLFCCEEVSLQAEVRWGKERRPLQFQVEKKQPGRVVPEPVLRPELVSLLESPVWQKSDWKGRATERLFDVPGVGICVPDLVFEKPDAPPVYLELLGYWSREAVWRRIEWAEAAPSRRVIFAASSRLRVSEELLEEDSGSALYVFKGTLSARAVLEKVEALAARAAE